MASLFDIQYQLINNANGQPLGNSPYFMRLSDGTSHFGYTDHEGFTATLIRMTQVTAEIFLGQEAFELSEGD